MRILTRLIQVLVLTVVCAQMAWAVPILVRTGVDNSGEGGYGSAGWSQITGLVDTATGNMVTVVTDYTNNAQVQAAGALWVNTGDRFGTIDLTAGEIANIIQFIGSGGRVVLFGENTSWTNWNNNILSVVGGAQAGAANGILNTTLVHELTAGVASINIPAGAAAAAGGTALFDQNLATLWGALNVLTFLDSNVLQDAFIGGADNLVFGQNLANWIAADVRQVPEPGTLFLLGLGLAGLGIARRRRKV